MLSFFKLKRKRQKVMSGCSNKIDLMAFSFVPEGNLISNGTKKLKYKIAVLNILYLQLSLKVESSI